MVYLLSTYERLRLDERSITLGMTNVIIGFNDLVKEILINFI